MQSQNRKKLFMFIALYVVIAAVLFGLFSLVSNRHKKNQQTDAGQYYDPNSKETVSNPKDKSPETNGGESVSIVYLGLSKLVDSGATQAQIDSLRTAIKSFSEAKKLNITEASVTVDKVTSVGSREETDESGLNFPLLVNRTTSYNIQVRFQALDSVSMKAYQGNTLIYEYKPTVAPVDNSDDSLVD